MPEIQRLDQSLRRRNPNPSLSLMEFRDSLSVLLPSRRDDEPPSLRQDILDELADHLACAYKRELLRGADANVAQAAVLEQFGDPAAVARRLWFDAMKGKIMTQRVLIGACLLLLVVVCGAAIALVRQQSLRAERQVAEANARLAQALAQAQATNQEMLKQLRTMAEAVKPGQTPDWIPVSFKLTQETLDGPPAVGYEVALGRGTAQPPARPGRRGRHRDGIQRGHSARLRRQRPRRFRRGPTRRLAVRPRSPLGRAQWMACPWQLERSAGNQDCQVDHLSQGAPGTGPVTLRVAWPADLAAKEYLVEASFTHAGVTYQAPLHWTLGLNPNFTWGSSRFILCGSREGEIKQADLRLDQRLYYWHFANPITGDVDFGSEKTNPTHLFADLRNKYARLEATAAKLDVGNYNLTGLVVLRSRPPHQLKIPGERFEVLAYTAGGRWVGLLHSRQSTRSISRRTKFEPPYPRQNGGMGGMPGGMGGMDQGRNESAARSKFVAVSDSFWQGTDAHFAVQPGATSGWTIQLPDEVIKALREQLKAQRVRQSESGMRECGVLLRSETRPLTRPSGTLSPLGRGKSRLMARLSGPQPDPSVRA